MSHNRQTEKAMEQAFQALIDYANDPKASDPLDAQRKRLIGIVLAQLKATNLCLRDHHGLTQEALAKRVDLLNQILDPKNNMGQRLRAHHTHSSRKVLGKETTAITLLTNLRNETDKSLKTRMKLDSHTLEKKRDKLIEKLEQDCKDTSFKVDDATEKMNVSIRRLTEYAYKNIKSGDNLDIRRKAILKNIIDDFEQADFLNEQDSRHHFKPTALKNRIANIEGKLKDNPVLGQHHNYSSKMNQDTEGVRLLNEVKNATARVLDAQKKLDHFEKELSSIKRASPQQLIEKLTHHDSLKRNLLNKIGAFFQKPKQILKPNERRESILKASDMVRSQKTEPVAGEGTPIVRKPRR